MNQLKIMALISVVLITPFLISEAFAEMNVTRMDNYEITEMGNFTYTHRLGLPMYIANSTGDYVAYLHMENGTMIELESGLLSYSFDKSACAMSIYNSGEMNQTSVAVIADNDWILKVAQNETESYSDIPENLLGCVITTDFQTDTAMINSTKSSVNGTISEVYTFTIKGLKHDLYFTNNNPSWNDHKFAWSNILLDTPKSFVIATVANQTNGDIASNMYSLFSGSSQPFQLGGDGILLDFANSETIEFNSSDFIWNGTGVINGFALYQQQSQVLSDVFGYVFKDGLDSLSTVKFISNPDQTLDVEVHYQNVTQPLGIGQTMLLDPLVTTTNIGQIEWRGNTGIECGQSPTIPIAFTIPTGLGLAEAQLVGNSENCRGTYFSFDITSIPDLADVQRWTFAVNVTAGACDGSGCQFASPMLPSRVFQIVGQDISGFSLVNFANALSRQCGGTTGCFMDTVTLGNFRNWCPFTPTNCALGGGFGIQETVGLRVINVTSFGSKHFVDMEAQLQAGKDFYQLVVCPTTRGGGCGFANSGSPSNRLNRIQWDATSFFEIEFEFNSTPTAPLNIAKAFTPSPDTCTVTWDTPASDGGRVITGYNILRNINNGDFTTLVADTTTLITSHIDTTIVAGEAYKYRVSAINAKGIGEFTETATTCGIPSISDPPTLNVLTGSPSPSPVIVLTWIRPDFDGSLPIDGYRIERSETGGSFIDLVADTGNSNTNFNDLGVQLDTKFTYRISTINSLGTSIPSNEQSFTIIVIGAGGGVAQPESPVAPPAEPVFPQEEFDLALAEALAKIPPQQITVFEQIVSTFFEFAVVDTSHEDLVLNSFLDNQRLGIRWSSGQDIVVVSAIPSLSPFLITFEQLPAVKQGSGAVISTDFLLYNLQVPRNACVGELTMDCVEKLRYEVPIVVNAIINGTSVSDTGIITVDLVDEILDPILLLILATFGIPLIGVFVQRRRGRKSTAPIQKVFQT